MRSKLEYIQEKFKDLQRKVEVDNKNRLFDINIILENLSMEILNATYGWNLKNANLMSSNKPSFDLIDYENKIIVEVKSISSASQINTFINRLKNEDNYSQYNLCMFNIKDTTKLTKRTGYAISELGVKLLDYGDILDEVKNDADVTNRVYKVLRDFFAENKWYVIYSKFSDALYEFYEKYKELSGLKLYEAYKDNDRDSELLSWVKNFVEYDVQSLDPIHIFASFTYWNITLSTRKKRMNLFCDLLEKENIDVSTLRLNIEKSSEDDYRYVPHPNITYIVSARSDGTQEEVWEFFSLVHQNIRNDRFKHLFNNINTNWYGVKVESVTMFMFWVNSENFIPLDKNTLELLKKKDRLSELPTRYTEYKELINQSNEFLFLYRNLAKIAINESFINELIDLDRIDIDSFFEKKVFQDKKENDLNKNTISSGQLEIYRVEKFEFELYYMVSGRAKKIVYRNDEAYINELNVINPKNINYASFLIIGIRALNNEYTKVLEVDRLYMFTTNVKISEDSLSVLISDNLSNVYNGYAININITAIVGKNGSGKSTIIDLLIMAFNNIAKSFDEKDELNELSKFFYTIQVNYSIHSLNSRQYKGEWLKKVFHKNDSYQTPILIEPYREEGNIDVNILEDLTKQRLLATILDYHLEDSVDYTKLTESKNATHLNIQEDSKKINSILKYFNEKSNQVRTQTIDDILNFSDNRKVIDYLNTYIGISSNNDLYQNYKKIAELYICYKVEMIANTYSMYYAYKDKVYTEEFLNLLIDDKTHRTFKLHQAIYFLKYGTLTSLGKIAIDKLSINIKDIAEKPSIVSSSWSFDNIPKLSVIELVPPPFFEIDIFLKDEISGEEDISFETLSSGEKQKIYSISSIIYHLQNIQSVHRMNDESIKYNNVNIILDEIELYFHPDMQRTYIYDLLQAIENKGGFNNISALNIIMVTHSPFILSDILESNIMYLDREDKKLENTFGANIHTLLDNSFFMSDGLMGKYAKEKIKSLIKKFNEYKDIDDEERDKKVSQTERDAIKRIISQIGEPFLKKKLFDMYFSIFDEKESAILLLEKEQEKLQKQIEKLKR